jgi:hypothetical protein
MDLEKFVHLRPYLYHLTDEINIPLILESRILNSTANLVKLAKVPDMDSFLKTRRVGHYPITIGKVNAKLRDQDPLFQKIVEKNLEGGWTFGDFVFSLNSRVFFWATEKDLRTHYTRYENQKEYPRILRFETAELFNENKTQPQFCYLNSGAPRCSAYYEEGAPPRGPKTFVIAADYERTPSSVREVTITGTCKLPENIWMSTHPDKEFKKVKLN